jgi:hypothetical protein
MTRRHQRTKGGGDILSGRGMDGIQVHRQAVRCVDALRFVSAYFGAYCTRSAYEVS